MADPSFFARVFDFLFAVAGHEWESITGIILVAEPFGELFIPEKWRAWLHAHLGAQRRPLALLAGAILLLYASFQAFDDVSKRLREVQTVGTTGQQAQIEILMRQVNQLLKEKEELAVQRHIPKDFKAITTNATAGAPASTFGEVYFVSSSDDESGNYSGEIFKALEDLGFNVIGAGTSSQGPGDFGIVIDIINPDTPSAQAQFFLKVFRDANMPVHVKKMEIPQKLAANA
jgi:hypothetical protein